MKVGDLVMIRGDTGCELKPCFACWGIAQVNGISERGIVLLVLKKKHLLRLTESSIIPLSTALNELYGKEALSLE